MRFHTVELEQGESMTSWPVVSGLVRTKRKGSCGSCVLGGRLVSSNLFFLIYQRAREVFQQPCSGYNKNKPLNFKSKLQLKTITCWDQHKCSLLHEEPLEHFHKSRLLCIIIIRVMSRYHKASSYQRSGAQGDPVRVCCAKMSSSSGVTANCAQAGTLSAHQSRKWDPKLESSLEHMPLPVW